MLDVELDIFSGRPNPRWSLSAKEEAELLDRLIADPTSVTRVEDAPSILGYRGYVLSASAESAERLSRFGIPPRFRVRSQGDLEVGNQRWLLSNDGASVLEDEVRGVAEAGATLPGEVVTDPAALAACSIFGTSNTDFSFWNGYPSPRVYNNCYNFASNWRNNTFAQPGRGTGQVFASLTVASIKAACRRDGYSDTCSGQNICIYLVIWPGQDFHFYRRLVGTSSQNRWGHKPGTASATNLDSSGAIIVNPQTCNRGNYTTSGAPYLFGPGQSRQTVA